ncbi:hypothetical protein FNI40_22360 [Salmonella enterica subsp. diarizonae]|nr:hypothetical protein [Salmonella enterica subsp. diarizonae]
MMNILNDLITHYSLWWQSNVNYTLFPEKRRSPRERVRRVCDGLLLSVLMLPGAALILEPAFEHHLYQASVMMAATGVVTGDWLFCLIMKRTIKNPTEYCRQNPLSTTVIFYLISHCAMVALYIYAIIFISIMNIITPYF